LNSCTFPLRSLRRLKDEMRDYEDAEFLIG
jgi:hypothetical protein